MLFFQNFHIKNILYRKLHLRQISVCTLMQTLKSVQYIFKLIINKSQATILNLENYCVTGKCQKDI